MSMKVTRCEFVHGMTCKEVCEFMSNIVRCRDCKHYYEVDNYHPKGNYLRRCCNYFDTYNDEVTPDDFCAWGERRES